MTIYNSVIMPYLAQLIVAKNAMIGLVPWSINHLEKQLVFQ
jgi:hypothetical protein